DRELQWRPDHRTGWATGGWHTVQASTDGHDGVSRGPIDQIRVHQVRAVRHTPDAAGPTSSLCALHEAQRRRQEGPMPAGRPRRPTTRPHTTTRGLYDSSYEHDSCGVGFVADLSGRRSHDIVEKALTVLRNLDHRGASGADPDDGDGVGILTQIPHELYRDTCDFTLPEAGAYAVGTAFLPTGEAERAAAVAAVNRIAEEEDLTVLGWRDLPVDPRP